MRRTYLGAQDFLVKSNNEQALREALKRLLVEQPAPL